MTITDEDLLDCFRGPGYCEYCGQWSRRREPHHVHPKGMGGGSRLDIAINIIALGGPFECACHAKHENGQKPLTSELRKVIAARENCTVAFLVEETARLLRLPRDGDPGERYPAHRPALAEDRAEVGLQGLSGRAGESRSRDSFDCLETLDGW